MKETNDLTNIWLDIYKNAVFNPYNDGLSYCQDLPSQVVLSLEDSLEGLLLVSSLTGFYDANWLKVKQVVKHPNHH